jgi:hypothetical protein
LRARRPTITEGDALESFACIAAAAPATIAAEADVPVTVPFAAAMPTPGATMKTALLWLLLGQTASEELVAPTPTTLASPAG